MGALLYTWPWRKRRQQQSGTPRGFQGKTPGSLQQPLRQTGAGRALSKAATAFILTTLLIN